MDRRLRDYREDRRTFLSAVRNRRRIEKGGLGSWSAWRRLEGEALTSALELRCDLGLSSASPHRFVIP